MILQILRNICYPACSFVYSLFQVFLCVRVHVYLSVCVGGRAHATEHRAIKGLARVKSLLNMWVLDVELRHPHLLKHNSSPLIQSYTGLFIHSSGSPEAKGIQLPIPAVCIGSTLTVMGT